MQPREVWPQDPIFIEIGIRDADLALGLRQAGFKKYLGVSAHRQRIVRLQARHCEIADQLVASQQRKIVLQNNAEVLILSGRKMLSLWRFRWVRHAEYLAWRVGFGPLSLVTLLACLCHIIAGRIAHPQVVALKFPGKKTRRLLVCRVLRQKRCYQKSLHFIPHALGLPGLFRRFDQHDVTYAVLRWFESLPQIEPDEDVDLLVDDRSLGKALEVLGGLPGIQPCDVYSETGLPRSDFCGTPYYPAHVASQILEGARRHKDLCLVPCDRDYFHSLAYHAVYHKGERSGLPNRAGLRSRHKPDHDYSGILKSMAEQLKLDVVISLEGLHEYLSKCHWAPSHEMLARLAAACRRNRWLQLLAEQVPARVRDQGLAVFVLRRQAVLLGFRDPMIEMIRAGGFEVLATKSLNDAEVEYAAARTRGGDWTDGPYEGPGGPPSVCVVAYDRYPLPLTRRQRRKFPHRRNARVFVKEKIRDWVLAQLPKGEGPNALHSSDHSAEAWHLIEVFAQEILDETRARVDALAQSVTESPRRTEPLPELRRAA
jgi:hypothetical protein